MGLRIKEIIREKKMTAKLLASKMGISSAGLSQHINGNPSLEVLERIASALDVQITDLFKIKSKKKEIFIENPFAKGTPVTIFGSGSQADDWFENNCEKCKNIKSCQLRKKILESNDGLYCVIPLWVAKRLGIDYDPLYQQGELHQCQELNTGEEPF